MFGAPEKRLAQHKTLLQQTEKHGALRRINAAIACGDGATACVNDLSLWSIE
jgi:hypothetical protein